MKGKHVELEKMSCYINRSIEMEGECMYEYFFSCSETEGLFLQWKYEEYK